MATAGPPCPDYSTIRGDAAPGTEGPEGQKFVKWCEWLNNFEDELGFRIIILVENVCMKPEWATQFDAWLHASHVVADAEDWQIIRRPRFWWTRITWPSGPLATTSPSSSSSSPQLTWKNANGAARLGVNNVKPPDLSNYCFKGQKFPKAVIDRQTTMPCLTTPAPTDERRSAPKKRKHDNGSPIAHNHV